MSLVSKGHQEIEHSRLEHIMSASLHHEFDLAVKCRRHIDDWDIHGEEKESCANAKKILHDPESNLGIGSKNHKMERAILQREKDSAEIPYST